MKSDKKIQAIHLRKQGIAITIIAKQLGVSKSSVSNWVRDIVLSKEQIDILQDKSKRYKNALLGAKSKRESGLYNRINFQNSGREKARELNWLHVAGCMLYWGEGSKKRHSCIITNSDAELLKFFLHFLYECYNVNSAQIRATVYAHTTENSIDKIESFWQKELNLPKTCFCKSIQNQTSVASKNKKLKNCLPFGTVSLAIHSTEIVQSIFGAIQEYCGNNDPKFL